MDEQQVRQIIRDEVNRQLYQSGSPKVLPHNHDGVNNLPVSIFRLSGFSSINGLPAGFQSVDTGVSSVINKNNLTNSATSIQFYEGNTVVYPIPTVAGGHLAEFNYGVAPQGTLLLESTGAEGNNLWLNIDGGGTADSWVMITTSMGGATGSFTSADAKTIVVTNGLVTSIS